MSGNQGKNWVIASLIVNDQDVPVVDTEDPNRKLKVDLDSGVMRVFFPGDLVFGNKDYEASKGSRLATDMDMGKVPDTVVFSLNVRNDIISAELQGEGGNTLFLHLYEDDIKIRMQLASKWSLKDFFSRIQSCRS